MQFRDNRDEPLVDDMNESLCFELQSMQARDQTLRSRLTVHGSFTQEESRMCEFVDRVNTARMKEIVGQYGWPGYSLVGPDGVLAALLITLHADRDVEFQEYCLGLMHQAVAAGDAPTKHLAFLTDRVRVNRERPQVYGTQFKIVEHQYILKEIEDPTNVNERRFQMGLPPIGPLS